ncbi:hypothetical protein ACIQUQ_05120 [Streptomyces sp. NPDC101118]|uniref:hypothetical protein n=1 Tax=Streptomyces sp. NPDC101118 TaxID=3366109 RepID=UPI0037FFF999
MAMVGLFWITEDAVYVGSPPAVDGQCVRLTSEGVVAEDPYGTRTWAWEELRAASVVDVPVKGTARRLGQAFEVLLAAVGGSGDEPAEMSLRLTATDPEVDVTEEVSVHAAVSGGYPTDEVELSQSLLARFVAGEADPGALTAWARGDGHHGTPKARQRQALLRSWAEA